MHAVDGSVAPATDGRTLSAAPSEEPDELIHGRPAQLTATVKNLRDFQKAFDLSYTYDRMGRRTGRTTPTGQVSSSARSSVGQIAIRRTSSRCTPMRAPLSCDT
ncbi:putative T7SS-secreted protein [Streptomyces sp. NPDC048484]|uniref:putative T7SS-secreted protein n=1 Tax=Streptomyces sp. NPDC048484 TaxID=3155146 RepID=UPI0034374079